MKSGNWKYVAVNKVLTEGGRVLLEHGGSFRSFINPAGNDAEKLVELIVENIPSYRDEATYEVWRFGYQKWHALNMSLKCSTSNILTKQLNMLFLLKAICDFAAISYFFSFEFIQQ